MAEEKKKTNNKSSKNTSNKKNVQTKKNEQVEKKNNKKKINENAVQEKKVKEENIVNESKISETKNENKKDSFIKKHITDVLLIAGALILVIIGIVCFKNDQNKENYLVELNYDQYVDMINSGEKFTFIVERATCTHCQNFMPVVKKFVNNKEVYVYYIDTDTLDEEEWSGLLESNTFFIDNSDDWGTPTTMILNGSEVVDTLVGETTEEEFEAFLVENGIME
jgi:predicted bacteriocin transport accessory protein